MGDNTHVDPATQLAIVNEITDRLKVFSDDIKGHIDLRVNPVEKELVDVKADVRNLKDEVSGAKTRISTLEANKDTSRNWIGYIIGAGGLIVAAVAVILGR